ncbi:MAG: Holliday junction branch migration protein RuvA [Chloroflexota bacterium]
MIAGIRGTITEIEEQAVVVDLHGFMVRVLAPGSTLANVGSAGDAITLKTHLIVREDSLTLYGFSTDAELTLFQLLLGVTGVGPRAALSLLSFAEPSDLFAAIANEDTSLLSKAPGIGKVTAGRIILDLRRKLPSDFEAQVIQVDDRDREALLALESLGYETGEARSALGAVDNREALTTEERIFAALRGLDRH